MHDEVDNLYFGIYVLPVTIAHIIFTIRQLADLITLDPLLRLIDSQNGFRGRQGPLLPPVCRSWGFEVHLGYNLVADPLPLSTADTSS